VAAFRHSIPADLWAELKHDKLIRSDAPTPA
jgi:D-threo-aldose 1-dehydrogenase